VLAQPGAGLGQGDLGAEVGHHGLQGTGIAPRSNLGVDAEGAFHGAASPMAQTPLRQRDGTEGGLPGESF
jgi:hypothetical protein